jgi:recombination protein RecT
MNQLKAKNDISSLIQSEHYQAEFARALPKHLTPDRFTRVALTAFGRTPKLKECTPASLLKCLMDLSALGLEPDGRKAHLIPYGSECTLIIDYKGLVELIRRSGDVATIRAEVVCENDEFLWENGSITHRVDWRRDRGAVQAVYAEATLKSGETQTATMTRAEVEAIRNRSRAGKAGPWVTDWAEMAKKTAVRRLSKMLPLSSEIASAIERDDDQFTMRNATPTKASVPSFISLPDAEEQAEDAPTENQ